MDKIANVISAKMEEAVKRDKEIDCKDKLINKVLKWNIIESK